MWWLWKVLLLLLLLCPLPDSSAESVLPQKMIGILGGFVTFRLETPRPSEQVLWHKNEAHVATLSPGPPCQLQAFGDYQGRQVTVSEKCDSVTVTGLLREDSGAYRAQRGTPGQQQHSLQAFSLKVYKRLSGADLRVTCAKYDLGERNETLLLNCSAGSWEEGTAYTWTSANGKEILSSGRSLDIPHSLQDDDQNVACVAHNPVGSTSRRVSLNQTCNAPEQPTTRPVTVNTTETGDLEPSSGQCTGMCRGVLMALLILCKVAICVCVYEWLMCIKGEPMEPNPFRLWKWSRKMAVLEQEDQLRAPPSTPTV